MIKFTIRAGYQDGFFMFIPCIACIYNKGFGIAIGWGTLWLTFSITEIDEE